MIRQTSSRVVRWQGPKVTILGTTHETKAGTAANSENEGMAHQMLKRPSVRSRPYQRGFTLVELMIVVAIIGVMSAIAMVGYRKYMNSARTGEAKVMLEAIRGAQETYKSEMLVYLNVSTSLTTYYPFTPATSTAGKKFAWVNSSGNNYANWALLNVKADSPVVFGYACVAGVGGAMTAPSGFSPTPTMKTLPAGQPWFVTQASSYATGNPNPTLFATSSESAELFSSNE